MGLWTVKLRNRRTDDGPQAYGTFRDQVRAAIGFEHKEFIEAMPFAEDKALEVAGMMTGYILAAPP